MRIVTPEKCKIDEDVELVVMRATNGDMGILSGHEARSAVLAIGALRIMNEGVERRIAVYGGLASVANNVLTILTNDAEWPEEINRARADEDREQAQRRLQERTDDIIIQEDLVLLRRALVQIEVSSFPYEDKPKTHDEK